MYAVIQAGAHQIRVESGKTITIDRLPESVGDKAVFDKVLLLGSDSESRVGQPFVENAKVEGVIKEHKRDKKVLIFKYKRRKNYKRTRGHRQHLTVVEITNIVTG